MTHLILIRHGETLWNEQKKYQGHADIGLSPKGKKNIQALLPRVKALGIDFLYTSSLRRARQSARIISAKTGLKPCVDSRLNELNFGRWEGKTADQLILQKDKSFLSWAGGKWKTPKGGESIDSLRRRVRGFLKDCLKKHKGKKIAIVSHGGLIRMIILLSLRQDLGSLFSFVLQPASLSILKFRRNVRFHIKR